jgi:hypothetical protein
VWPDKIAFRKLNLPNPGRVPVGPNAVIDDDIGFSDGPEPGTNSTGFKAQI